ncbi:ATP-binding protein [Arachnia propionica]|uniref:ATP-binding protein n=1 Tax=Arachnia propionica TaxID=1750 RepID=UPI0021AB3776|nr:ATP-binding protein [Arachnia propionica]
MPVQAVLEQGYRWRIIDDELDVLLSGVAAVALDGPKGIGKTTTALQRAASILRLDRVEDRTELKADPDALLTRPCPLLIDEWQRLAWVWDSVRRAVDDGAEPGAFLLTGSATPTGEVTHSGAGRIVSLRMRPLALPERGIAHPTVSLSALLDGEGAALAGECQLRLPDYVEEIAASGFPGIRGLPPRVRRIQLDSYLTRAFTRDLRDEQGVRVRHPATLRAWARAYAAASSTTTSWEHIRHEATPGDGDPPSRATAVTYRDWLTALWLLDPVAAWLPVGAGLGKLQQAQKHQLADPALVMRLMSLDPAMLMREGRAARHSGGLLGALFESLATQTVRVLAQAAEAQTYHMRTANGAREVDLVVERFDGRCLGIEVKLTAAPDDDDVRHLRWLRDKAPDRVADVVILTTGSRAYRRRDGVGVIPLGLLGP